MTDLELSEDQRRAERLEIERQMLESKRTLPGGFAMQPPYDDGHEPFPLVRVRCRLTNDLIVLVMLMLGISCSAPEGRFLMLESYEVRGAEHICIYSDAIGARAVTLDASEACPPYLELDE